MKWKRNKKEFPYDLDELKELSEPSPVRTWVNLFLMHMHKEHLENVVLKKSEGIPPISYEDEVPEGGFDFDKIINRLKVMSGLDPETFKKPREGNIRVNISGRDYIIKTTFLDSYDDSKCEITMS